MAEFANLFEKKFQQMVPGSIIKACILSIDDEYVTVDAGLKSEGLISTKEFKDREGNIKANIGEIVEVALIAFEDGYGETLLSREKAKWIESWAKLNKSLELNETVVGYISSRVKGGFTVELNGVKAFLPGSLVDVRPVRDSSYLENKELEFKIIKMDTKRNNVVVSRRAVVEESNSSDIQLLLQNLQEGMEVKGVVKNVTDYGAFIDLGGVDGLLHITDMSWKRVKHPSEFMSVGDEIDVKILKFDRDRNRVSLGMKQLGDDPWLNLAIRYPIGKKLSGKVTNLTDYGCFVEIEEGVEGLVHMSEMDWTNKNINPGKLVKINQEVDIMVLEIDEARRRISLGMKQCVDNPWDSFSMQYKKGDTITGQVKSITDFGIFIGLIGDIDGLIHLSDISWDIPGEEVVRKYKKGDTVKAVILAIDSERERISLGIKQLKNDPFSEYTEMYNKGAIVNGKVISVDNKSATLLLTENVTGQLKASEFSFDKTDDLSSHIHQGDKIEVIIIRVDRKNRQIHLSIRAKATQSNAENPSNFTQSIGNATLGDLLKEQMNSRNNEDN